MPLRFKLYGATALLLQALLITACQQNPPEAANNLAATAAPTNETLAEIAAPQGPERLILAFGDSLYAGYGLAPGQSLPDRLQQDLRKAGINARLVNAGVSGDTTAAGRQRLTFALDNLPRKPDLVLLGLGGNDALRQLSPSETRANMTAMMDELKKRQIPVVLTGMIAPPNLGPDYAASFNSIWPELARKYNAPLYPFILDGVVGQTSLMLMDGIHPNARGIQMISEKVAPLLKTSLASQQTAPASPEGGD